MRLLFFTLMMGLLVSSDIMHIDFDHIYDVDAEAVPSVHQRDFISSLMRADKRRSILEQPGFFRLHGISSNDGKQHEFLMKPAMQHRFQVVQDGQQVDVDFAPVFNGYSVADPLTILAVSFPSINSLDAKPIGMVHHRNGEHHMFAHNEEHGLHLVKVDTSSKGDGDVVHPCGNKDGEHEHEHEGFDHEEQKGYLMKRELEVIEEVMANGIGTPALIQVETVVQSDAEFAARFPNGGVTEATNYIRSFFSAINTIYERDLRATLVLQYFGFNNANPPATNLDDLNVWLNNNPNVDAIADIAVVLNGAKGGGLGYVGTFCRDKQTSHSGVNANWGKNLWDSPNDVIVTAHELGHVLGSPHTHDSTGYSPVIDSCGTNTGTPSVIPVDGGSVMSYCHIVTGSQGWGSINLSMGSVGQFGVQSERVNIKVRALLEKGQCLTSPDPTWAPFCSDTSAYTWSDGSAISCPTEASKGRCPTAAYMAAPNCMKSCGRCKTTTTAVTPNIPLGATNCVWSEWAAWSGCSATCGSGTRTASRTVTTAASNGGTCTGENSKSEACNTQACPVNCAWSAWSAWSACSLTCGGGSRSATRTVATPAANGGTACTGETITTQACNTQACPVDCTWGDWGPWGACTVACGGGTMTATRLLSSPASNGGSCSAAPTKTEACNTFGCASNCVWSEWAAWTACSTPCGTGSRTTSRAVVTPESNGGVCTGETTKSENCNTQACPTPVNCVWGEWAPWSACSSACAGGSRSTSRVVATPAANGGVACNSQESTKTEVCNTQPCAVNCVWAEWSAWSGCSAPCGSGTRSANRAIVTPAANGGTACTGESSKSEACNTQSCAAPPPAPVNCVWADWSAWSTCSVNCGSGTRTATRTVAVAAANGGSACTGESTKSEACNTQGCPVDCAWSTWSAWSSCSKSCGTGSRTATRTIETPLSNGGAVCAGDVSKSEDCNTQDCPPAPVNCVWGEWAPWSACTATCGSGTRSTSRIVSVHASNGGIECTGPTTQDQACNTEACPPAPVNCVWGEWTAWSACTAACGTGSQASTRAVATQAAFGGAACTGESSRTQTCNTQGCPVNCVWSEWGPWGTCSNACGAGSRTASRTIVTPAANGGQGCTESSTKTEACTGTTCPTNCVWGNWGVWSACTKACGSGTRTATRTVSVPATNGGTCVGESSMTETCNTQVCPVPCDDTPKAGVTRGGFPINCRTEAIIGACGLWFNQAPNCLSSCGWNNCPIPCDDIPNPYVTVTFNGVLQNTCAQQAKLGYCSAAWMNTRACRISCRRCTAGGLAATEAGTTVTDTTATQGQVTVSVDTIVAPLVDDTVLFDQGSSCITNKGMPSTRFAKTESGARSVDDFVVPAGKTWKIREVQVMGNWFAGEATTTSTSTATATTTEVKFVPFHVTIFHKGSIQCKTSVNVPLPVPQVLTLDITSAGCGVVGAHEGTDGSIVMADETYYITVSPLVSVHEQFYWSFSKTANGQVFKWRDTKDIFGLGRCPQWTDGHQCGIPTQGTDLCFQLMGSSAETNELDRVFMSDAATSNEGDGEIGSDSREAVAWSAEQAAAEVEVISALRTNAKSILSDLTAVPEEVGSITDNSQAVFNGQTTTPTHATQSEDKWLIPVAVTLSIMGAAAMIGVIAIIVKSRQGATSQYREVV